MINPTSLLCRLARSPGWDASLADRLRAQSWSNCIRGGPFRERKPDKRPLPADTSYWSVREAELWRARPGLGSISHAAATAGVRWSRPQRRRRLPEIPPLTHSGKRITSPILLAASSDVRQRVSLRTLSGVLHARLTRRAARPLSSAAPVGADALLRRISRGQQTHHQAGIRIAVPGMPGHLCGRCRWLLVLQRRAHDADAHQPPQQDDRHLRRQPR